MEPSRTPWWPTSRSSRRHLTKLSRLLMAPICLQRLEVERAWARARKPGPGYTRLVQNEVLIKPWPFRWKSRARHSFKLVVKLRPQRLVGSITNVGSRLGLNWARRSKLSLGSSSMNGPDPALAISCHEHWPGHSKDWVWIVNVWDVNLEW